MNNKEYTILVAQNNIIILQNYMLLIQKRGEDSVKYNELKELLEEATENLKNLMR